MRSVLQEYEFMHKKVLNALICAREGFALLVAFVILKLAGVLSLSWWWICLPAAMWILGMIGMVFYGDKRKDDIITMVHGEPNFDIFDINEEDSE